MNVMIFDRLAYTETLKNSGIDEKQALAHANALDSAMRDSVATKQDTEKIEAKIDTLRTELEAKINTLRSDLEAKISDLEAKIDVTSAKNTGEQKLTRWMLALVIVSTVIPLIRDLL